MAKLMKMKAYYELKAIFISAKNKRNEANKY